MTKRKQSQNKRSHYRYDVAISHAGEDHKLAARLARFLRRAGYSVFYDRDQEHVLWGKNESEIERIFGSDSRFVIPLISKHYVAKDWCRHEFDGAKDEARKRQGDFILPLRLDDTRLLGLNSGTFFQDLRQKRMSQIADLFVKKITDSQNDRPSATSEPSTVHSENKLFILDTQRRYALGLLVLSFLPVDIRHLRSVFPDIKWKSQLDYLRRKGLVTRSGEDWEIPSHVRKAYPRGSVESDKINSDWIVALTPLAEHPDTGFALATHLIVDGQRDAAISLLADIALSLDSGTWNTLYLELLELIESNLRSNTVLPDTLATLRNALGICLSRDGRNQEAIKMFGKLRRGATRNKIEWAIAQSYINMGAAQFYSGAPALAEKTCRMSITYARQIDDFTTLARSISNLAQLLVDSDPKQARELLEEGISIKNSVGDLQGVVVSYLILGNLSVRMSDPTSARNWYQKAFKKARKLDMRNAQSEALLNWGRIEFEWDNDGRAIELYSAAHKIAIQEEFVQPQMLFIRNMVDLHSRRGEYKKAHALLGDLSVLCGQIGDTVGSISARYEQAVQLINDDQFVAGRRGLRRIQKHILEADLPASLILQVYFAYARSYFLEGKTKLCIRSIESLASEIAQKNSLIAAEFLINAAELTNDDPDYQDCSLGYYRQAGTLLSREKTTHEVLALSAICDEAMGEIGPAIRMWKRSKAIASRNHNSGAVLDAAMELARLHLDNGQGQKAMHYIRESESHAVIPPDMVSVMALHLDILIESGEYVEAERACGKAIRLCRKHELIPQSVDLHMKMGDHLWRQGRRRQYTALKAYTAGLLKSVSLEEDGTGVFDVGVHITSALHRLLISDGSDRFEALRRKIESWLAKEIDAQSTHAIEWLLWPFRVASALFREFPSPESVTADQITLILSTEVESWSSFGEE